MAKTVAWIERAVGDEVQVEWVRSGCPPGRRIVRELKQRRQLESKDNRSWCGNYHGDTSHCTAVFGRDVCVVFAGRR